MQFHNVMQLLEKYTTCPCCNNQRIGENGTLVVDDTTFTRTCNCGWSVKIIEDSNGELQTLKYNVVEIKKRE